MKMKENNPKQETEERMKEKERKLVEPIGSEDEKNFRAKNK